MRSAGRARAAALAASAAGLAAAASCSDDRAPPARLVDGTPARIARIGFENVTVPVIATVRRERLDTALPGCASRMVARRVVERIGVAGASITLVANDVIRACDAIRRGTWCGHAFAWTSTPSSSPTNPKSRDR